MVGQTKKKAQHFKGSAQSRQPPFFSSSRGAPFWGVPLDVASYAPSTQRNTENAKSFHLMCDQAPCRVTTKLGRPHSAAQCKFVRARGPQHWNPEVFEQTRCSRILHVEFPQNNRELVKAEVLWVFEQQTTPFKLRNEGGIFLEQPFGRNMAHCHWPQFVEFVSAKLRVISRRQSLAEVIIARVLFKVTNTSPRS